MFGLYLKNTHKLRQLTLVFVLLALVFCGTAYPGSFSKEYDAYFRVYAGHYLADYSWLYLKAQGYQESLLDKDAVSHAGAQGVMQIMPGTWEEQTERLGIIASPFNPRANILVGASYMKRMVSFWKAPRPKIERLRLAQASYNAGAGNILKAQRKCQNKSLWKDISPCLVQVTGRHSEETITYVGRIQRWYEELVAQQ